ncbi:MAG: hypothetical protein IKU25_07715 [Clostridia bacterium]|nr:hypothetical protein [Clostridia bacterium]
MAKKKSTKAELTALYDKNRINRNVAVNYCSFAAASLVTIFIGFLLSFVKMEIDFDAVLEFSFYENAAEVTSQISRTLQYFVCSIGFVLLYALFYHLLNKKIKENVFSHTLNTIVHFVSMGVLIFLALYLNVRSQAHYFLTLSNSIFSGFFSILLVIIGFLLTVYFAFNKFSVGVEKFGGVLAVIICLVFVFAVAYVHIANSFYLDNPAESFHCEVVFHSIHQIYSGYTPLVDFTSTYGLFVYLYLPLELLLGGVTMLNTSIVSVFFMLISMLCLMYCAFRLCKNKVIAAVTTIAMVSTSIMNISASWYFDPSAVYLYWQYTPIRLLFPSIILALCCASLNKKSRWMNFLRYALSGIAFWANLETGIACLATSVAFDVYGLLLELKLNDRSFWKNAGKSVLKVILSVVASTALVCGITIIRSGRFPDLGGIITDHFQYLSMGGYFYEEIDFLEIWILVVIVYAILLAKSLRHMAILRNTETTETDPRATMYFVTAFMGVCLFVYYVGRYFHISLMHCSYPALLGVGMLIQGYYDRIADCFKSRRFNRQAQELKKNPADNGLNLLKFLGGFVCLFISVALGVALLVNPNYFVNGKQKPQTLDTSRLGVTVQFLDEHYDANRDGEIDIFTYNTSTLYAELGMKNPMTFPQLEEWYYRYDIFREAEIYLSNTENHIFIDKNFLENHIGKYIENAYQRGITDNPDFVNWLKYERCKIVAENERYLLLKPIAE